MKDYIYNKVYIQGCLRLVVLLLCQWMAVSVMAQPADTIKTYTREHPLIYEDAWDLWPYCFLNENGEPVGYNIDLLRMICSKLDIPYVIRLKPTPEALNDLKAGRSDLMCGMDAAFHNEYAKYGKSVIQIFTHSVVHQKNMEHPVENLQKKRRRVSQRTFGNKKNMKKSWKLTHYSLFCLTMYLTLSM